MDKGAKNFIYSSQCGNKSSDMFPLECHQALLPNTFRCRSNAYYMWCFFFPLKIFTQHLLVQYDELVPALCNNHPDVFPPELYTWEQFLWACELWYSNSMKVMFVDGKLRTCLIPIAGFLNHSVSHSSSVFLICPQPRILIYDSAQQ